MGMIPKRTRTDQEFSIGILNVTLKRVMGLVVTVTVSAGISQAMPKGMAIGFMVFCVASFLILTKKAPSDPGKLYYRGLLDYISYLFLPKTYYSKESKEYILTQKRKEDKRLEKEKKRQSSKRKDGKKERTH